MKNLLAHLFLPHHTNKYRAKILHHKVLIVFITVLFAGNFVLSNIPQRYESVLGLTSSITPHELLVLTNLKREERGLPALVMNNELSQAAQAKAADMFAKNYWAHIAPDGTTPWFFIRNSGYEYLHAGENLARGFTTSGDVVNAWMESPGHRDNMLSANYQDIGFAVLSGTLTGDETVLVVEMFGSKNNRSPSIASVEVKEVVPSPTPTVIQPAVISVAPTTTPVPTVTIPEPTVEVTPTSVPIQVAAAQNNPLINKTTLQRNIVFGLMGIILSVLAIDHILIRRRKISHLLSHNLDHIIFFGILLITAIVISKGAIL